MTHLKINEFVTGIYKTGKYIGELTNENDISYVVRILAVLKHPVQGDLHHPKQVNQGFFHERKALAFREQANIPKTMVKPFQGEIPNYQDSLHHTFHELLSTLQQGDSIYAQKSIETLRSIQREYELMYNMTF
ncbi:kinase-associated lipoprotein B [Bacillus sp. 2205SS5-2]|uniref:kinase-associated lipoprotein B n=1 Tax=Bacillus sp. 2205SS5-2 TaxID=3109031 RepID=UPI003007672E